MPPSSRSVAPLESEMYDLYMTQLPISDARKQLPELVKRAQKGEVIEITVRGEVVARLLAPEPDPGAAGSRLLRAMRALRGSTKRGRVDVSSRKNEHLTRRGR
jgi:prevent-host-death family protein